MMEDEVFVEIGILKLGSCTLNAGSRPNSWDRGLRRARECAMCISEEMSVVLLPCAHKVLCAKCNELHKKQGSKECPSCRTPIKWRVPARFAGS